MTKPDLIHVDRSAFDTESLRDLDDMDRIFTEAVSEARKENRRRGIPSYSAQGDQVVEELPDGTTLPVEDLAVVAPRRS